ncbi:MAG: FapA family protein [Candidatus Gracilibacteria bacterium]|nr:FapA family protein [Candidatus Gracilibacteria bacterium]
MLANALKYKKPSESYNTSSNTDSLVYDISEKVNNSIGILAETIKKYPFLSIESSGELIINTEHKLFNSDKLIGMIDFIFDSKLGFDGLNYENLENLLYDEEKGEKIVISKGVKKTYKTILDNFYKGLYEEKDGKLFLILDNFDETNKRKLINLLGEDKYNEMNMGVNFDDLFAYIWIELGIRFGYNFKYLNSVEFSGIKREELNKSEVCIASIRKPVNDQNDEINLGANIKFVKREKQRLSTNDKNKTINEYTYPNVKKGDIVAQLKIGKKGHSGVDLKGNIIGYEKAFEIDEKSFVNEGQKYLEKKVDIIDGYKIISYIAKEELYLNFVKNKSSVDIDYFARGRNVGINVSPIGIINSNDIGIETGSMEIKNENTMFLQKGNISEGYYLKGSDIYLKNSQVMSGSKVIASYDIYLHGDTNICNGTLQTLKGGVISNKETKIHTNSKIFAVNGKVVIKGDIEQSTIVADEIIIEGNVNTCTLVAKNITLIGNVKKSKLRGEKINVNIDDGENELVIIVFYAIDKFKRYLDQINSNKAKFNIRLKSLIKNLNDRRAIIKSLKEKLSITKDVKTKENLTFEIHKSLRELDNIKNQGDQINNKMNEDKNYSERIKRFIKYFEDKKDGNVLRILKGNSNSDIYIHPTGIIFDDEEHISLNPNDISNRMKNKMVFLQSLIEFNFKNEKRLIVNETGTSVPLTHIESLEMLKNHMETMNSNINTEIMSQRLDERRHLIIKHDTGALFDTSKLNNAYEIKKHNLINVNIDGMTDCYLNDLSLKGASFLVNNNNAIHKENTSIDVKFELKTEQGTHEIKSSFWITRIEDKENHKKISGFFLGSTSENLIAKYFNYIDSKQQKK